MKWFKFYYRIYKADDYDDTNETAHHLGSLSDVKSQPSYTKTGVISYAPDKVSGRDIDVFSFTIEESDDYATATAEIIIYSGVDVAGFRYSSLLVNAELYNGNGALVGAFITDPRNLQTLKATRTFEELTSGTYYLPIAHPKKMQHWY